MMRIYIYNLFLRLVNLFPNALVGSVPVLFRNAGDRYPESATFYRILSFKTRGFKNKALAGIKLANIFLRLETLLLPKTMKACS